MSVPFDTVGLFQFMTYSDSFSASHSFETSYNTRQDGKRTEHELALLCMVTFFILVAGFTLFSAQLCKHAYICLTFSYPSALPLCTGRNHTVNDRREREWHSCTLGLPPSSSGQEEEEILLHTGAC